MNEVFLIGAGRHAKVIADVIRSSGGEVAGFFDDGRPAGSPYYGSRVMGSRLDALKFPEALFIIAIGDNAARRSTAGSMALKYHTAIHPSAIVSNSAKIGEGTVVMANAVINADARIGRHCIINTGCVVEHDNEIGDFAHISPGAATGGGVWIGEGCHIGLGAAIRNNVSICPGAVIGVGGAVVKDITQSGVYVGVPARPLIK